MMRLRVDPVVKINSLSIVLPFVVGAALLPTLKYTLRFDLVTGKSKRFSK